MPGTEHRPSAIKFKESAQFKYALLNTTHIRAYSRCDLFHVRTQNFCLGRGGGRSYPEAMYNLCSILKIML
jgi:hypothetical protein